MNGTQADIITHQSTSETRSTGMLGALITEGFGALATMALAIVGLAGVFSNSMAAIAGIVASVATMVEGGAFGLKTIQTSALPSEGRWFESAASADLQGGLAALVLSVLALLGISTVTLLSIAVIALGATFLLSGRALIGIAAAVLGILAVMGFAPVTLILVGFLALGARLAFSAVEGAASSKTVVRS